MRLRYTDKLSILLIATCLRHDSLIHPASASVQSKIRLKLWLTKGAVRELNRRNAQPTPYPSYLRCRKPNRPLTRQLLATLKNNRRLVQIAAGFLRNCVPNYSKDIKQFAKHGGPDLSDLRGFPEPINPLDRTVVSGRSRSRRRKRSTTLTPSSKTQGTQDAEVTKTTSTTAYKRNFEQNLIDHGVYPPEYDYPDGRFPLNTRQLGDHQ
ncbi:hypothetical protein ACJ73_09187 [Blastomyces percursus]|uniref:Uncharacterized protein n=1 Tax=Blastomyces percursus TaxID=1658174 RepID=A0A1J9PC99_9EURO|nr:hypothetical protein ACJ73_09187 [Blastomyces percursus]